MASIPLPNGAQVALATTYGSAKPVSDISNANPGVFTAEGHGLSNGALVLAGIEGWTKVDNTVLRIADSDTDTFTVPGLNTSNTGRFPAGSGKGSVKPITAWTQLPKIPTFELTGGDAKTQTTSYLDYEKDYEIFTGTNPERLNFTISYNPDGEAYASLQEAHESGELQVVRLVLKDGSALYYVGQVFFNKVPVTTKDQEMVNNVSIALQGEITRYAKLSS